MKLRVLVVTAATMAILITGAVPMFAQGTCPPLTQGYWKTHTSAWNDGGGLTLGTNFYTNAQLETILQSPVRGDASVSLAHQLIAALLNIATINTDATLIQGTLDDANNLIGSGIIPEHISPSSTVGRNMAADESVLDDFNSGGITNACGSSGPPM